MHISYMETQYSWQYNEPSNNNNNIYPLIDCASQLAVAKSTARWLQAHAMPARAAKEKALGTKI